MAGGNPTGTDPLVFFSGATASWHTNQGSGGGFTENGALTDAATNPPSEPQLLRIDGATFRGVARGMARGLG